jgi:hypothetical protein
MVAMMARVPSFADTSLDRARFEENERLNRFQQQNPWNPHGEPVKASPAVVDPETTAINARMQDEQRQILQSRQQTMAQPESFGLPWQIDPSKRQAPAPSRAYAPSQDEQINKRQAIVASQHTSPFQPTQGIMPYQRLERTADYMSPRAAGDPHAQRIDAIDATQTPPDAA